MAVIGVTAGHLTSGTVRALAAFEKERVKAYPNIPTAAELGYPIFTEPILGHGVPKGTPKKIVDKLAQAHRESIEANKTTISEQLKKMELYLEFYGPDESYKKVRENYEYFSKLAPDVFKK